MYIFPSYIRPTMKITVSTYYWSEAEAFRWNSHSVEIAAIQRGVENVEQHDTIVVVDCSQIQCGDYWRLCTRIQRTGPVYITITCKTQPHSDVRYLAHRVRKRNKLKYSGRTVPRVLKLHRFIVLTDSFSRLLCILCNFYSSRATFLT